MLDNHTDPKVSLFRAQVTVDIYLEDYYESESQILDYVDDVIRELTIEELVDKGIADIGVSVSDGGDDY